MDNWNIYWFLRKKIKKLKFHEHNKKKLIFQIEKINYIEIYRRKKKP